MLILLSIIILILLNLIILFSLKNQFLGRKRRNSEVKISSGHVGISIIAAAKDEELNVKSLIKCLKEIDYETDNFEVIFVDDHSTDNTFNEINESINGLKNFRVISISDSVEVGKRCALTKGIESSQFRNILITDADCMPEPQWLKASSKKFNEEFDFIFGIAPFEQTNSIINKISCFENLRNSILTFSFAGLGLPYSAAARNLGFTKSAFEKIGGYSNTKQSLSGDDDLLLREAVKNKLKIGTVTAKGSFVYSKTKETFKEYLNQKSRHTQTSAHYLLKHKLLLSFWHFLNLFSLFSVVLIIFDPLWGILPALKLLLDFLIVKINKKRFGYQFNFFEISFLQIIYEILLILHFINSKFMRIEWKQN